MSECDNISIKIWGEGMIEIRKKKFLDERKEKEFTQVALQVMRLTEGNCRGMILGFDLNIYWKPKIVNMEYDWGTVREKTFLFMQLVTLNIKDFEAFERRSER